MSIFRSARRLLLAASALVLLSAAAEAQIRYIASTGSNSNNCRTPATACRTLQKGITATPANGELRILDSAAYGGGLINKTITISADNETVSLNAPLTIDAAGAVTLRGLSLNGHYVAGVGIRIDNAWAVHIDHCTIEHFTGTGIESVSNGTRLYVTDSVSRNNGSAGLYIRGTNTVLTVDNSRFENNVSRGIWGEGGTVGSVTRAVLSGNGGGIHWVGGSLNVVSSMAGNNVGNGYLIQYGGRMYLESSVARGNTADGLTVIGSVALISNFTATYNGYGIDNIGGTVVTRQNNTVYANGTNYYGPQPTPLPPI